jgi:hypothetical protein
MDWYNILSIILGALGGAGVSLYTAKSNKDTIDISNFQRLIEEEREERRILKEEYKEYKESVDRKVEKVKIDFEKLQKDNKKMITSIFQAYKCKLPEKINDCPVIKLFLNQGGEQINGTNTLDGLENGVE